MNDWKSIIKTFQRKKMNIIIECENPEIIACFTIGPIKRITKKSVYIGYFNAVGCLDEKLIKTMLKIFLKLYSALGISIFSESSLANEKNHQPSTNN